MQCTCCSYYLLWMMCRAKRRWASLHALKASLKVAIHDRFDQIRARRTNHVHVDYNAAKVVT
jgi:hypothetical protein